MFEKSLCALTFIIVQYITVPYCLLHQMLNVAFIGSKIQSDPCELAGALLLLEAFFLWGLFYCEIFVIGQF